MHIPGRPRETVSITTEASTSTLWIERECAAVVYVFLFILSLLISLARALFQFGARKTASHRFTFFSILQARRFWNTRRQKNRVTLFRVAIGSLHYRLFVIELEAAQNSLELYQTASGSVLCCYTVPSEFLTEIINIKDGSEGSGTKN